MSRLHRFIPPLLALPLALGAVTAQAVPSFARQTGLACMACHTVFPELTPFGRSFKLNGYTLTGIKQVEAMSTASAAGLKFNQIPPLSAMLQVSSTFSKGQQPTSQISLPDQLSFFFAGEITPHIGSFMQMTMDNTGNTFAIDNTDIRYANHAGQVTYGVTLNNNPTVQDLWNSSPAWGYPWTHGASITQPMVAGGLAQAVAGLGGYADWGNGIYTELSMYRETNAFDATGLASGTSTKARIRGLAPYARLAWHQTLNNGDSLMVGTYGMRASVYDTATPPAAGVDKYTDLAVDTQYEHPFANNGDMLSIHGTYTHEKQDLAMSAPGNTPTLKSLRLDGTYHWGYHATATLAYAQNSGYNGAYDDNAWTAQASYLPWQNTKFTLQYVGYTKLAGKTGSAATDNNTWLLQGWFMW